MSYHLTILRTKSKARVDVTAEEFEAAARQFPELRFDPVLGKAEYYRDDELRANLMHQDGEICTNVAEPDVIQLMIRLAEALGARVRGDEFETYRTTGETFSHPDDEEEREEADASGKALIRAARKRQWILNLSIFGTFVVLSLIVGYCSRQ